MYVDSGKFATGINLLNELIERGLIYPLVTSDGVVEFEYGHHRREFLAALGDRELTRAGFDEFILDLTDVLVAQMAGASVDSFVRVRQQPRAYLEQEVTEDEAIAREKYSLVSTSFDIANFRARAWIKRTSKVQSFRGLDWETLTKHTDDFVPRPSQQSKFAIARIVTDNTMDDDRQTFTFVIDEGDLKYLLDLLGHLAAAMDEDG